MIKLVYTLTLNPALDYYLIISELKPDIQIADSSSFSYGGKGINVSVILNHLGIETTALGFVGGYNGKRFCDLLNAEKIKTDFVNISGETRINVKIDGASKITVNAKGPSISLNDEKRLIETMRNIRENDYLVLSGSIPSSMGSNAYERLVDSLRTTNPNFNLVVDTSGEALRGLLKYNPFLIKPNNFELEEILGKRLFGKEDFVAGAIQLQNMGAKNVLISLGNQGMILVTKNGQVFNEPIIEGEVINTNGCGDSAVGGFIAGYFMTGDYKNALHLASICANATAFSDSIATKEQIEALVRAY